MEKELNIAKILINKSEGIKLYSPIFGKGSLHRITANLKIVIGDTERFEYYFNPTGKYTSSGECLLFPSNEMRDWSKFTWKKGDVLVSSDGGTEIIFDNWYDDTYTNFYGKHRLDSEDENNVKYNDAFLCTTERYSLEDKDAAQTYINTIEERLDGKLNLETLEIEPVKPKHVFKALEYILSNDNEDNEWTLCQFSHFDKKGNAVFVGGSYANKGKVILPYKGNEHLLGTTNSLE